MDSANKESASWRSLFLPIEEEVIFTSFITLLSTTRAPLTNANVQNGSDQMEYSMPVESAPPSPDVGVDRSPLFALCGSRADDMVCVLSNRDVLFVDMRDGHEGPKIRRRLRGTKALRGSKGSNATCAALLPLDISHCCRVGPTATGRFMYLRGVVGSSDGRVDIFSEHGYVFGFVAHDAPIVAVRPIYATDADGADPNEANLMSNTRPPLSHPDGAPEGAISPPLLPNGTEEERRFQTATSCLGFVTSGADGAVLIWRRSGLSLRPRVVSAGALLTPPMQWTTVQPGSRDWLLMRPLGSNRAADLIPTTRASLLLHTTPGTRRALRVRSAVSLDDVSPAVPLPGSRLSRTSAIAADATMALLARGRKVYRVVFADAQCDTLLTAEHPIARLELSMGGLAVAACEGGNGMLYILHTQRGALLGSYTAKAGGPIRGVALHAGAKLLAIVAAKGTVEVAVMPDWWETAGSAVGDAVPAAKALECLAQLEKEQTEQREGGNLSERDQAELRETLTMARISMPEEMNQYLHRNATVM